MAEILGLGCTHRPVMMRNDDFWTMAVRGALKDPDFPEEMRDQSKWPPKMREELGNDFGLATARRHRVHLKKKFAEMRRAIDAFKPDVVIMWGDDQYENFKEDLVPPFAILAYEDQEIQPWKDTNNTENPWGEAVDWRYRINGNRQAGKYLASRLIESGFDIPYAYKPLHHELGHSFKYTVLLLDDERRGFPYPLLPFHVNCYGSRMLASGGLRLPLAMKSKLKELDDPPSPKPSRCMEIGAATARIMAESPWRTLLMASSSWSHAFLTEKNNQLWPDVEADLELYRALEKGDYGTWRQRTTAQLEDSGQHEMLNWYCLVGAMEELGRKPNDLEFIETWALNSPCVFAYFDPEDAGKPRVAGR